MEFDQYIKNVDAIDVEFMPDDSQVKLQVRSGEDIHLFLFEGKGAKIAAETYLKKLEKIEQLKEKNNDLTGTLGSILRLF